VIDKMEYKVILISVIIKIESLQFLVK